MKKFVDAMIPGGFDSRKHPAKIESAINNASAIYEEYYDDEDIHKRPLSRLMKDIQKM